jgi:hypothetical protein
MGVNIPAYPLTGKRICVVAKRNFTQISEIYTWEQRMTHLKHKSQVRGGSEGRQARRKL